MNKHFIALLLTAVIVAPAHARTDDLKRRYDLSIVRACRHRSDIISAAKAEGVSATHMVGCLISEHTYLNNWVDNAVDGAALAGIYGDPSIGYTQIKLSVGRTLATEFYGPRIEKLGRDQYGHSIKDRVVITDLLLARRATRYMARLIHHIVDDYKSAGFDISNSIGLVCSSYLIGNSEAKAKEHRLRGTEPALNYYGTFALKHEADAEAVVSGDACK